MSRLRASKSELARIYGKKCMFEKAGIAKRIEEIGGIRTYKKFLTQQKFKGKKINHRLTFHHLRHRSEGGDNTPQNGALLSRTAHEYIHSLPREQEEIVNNMLREYKVNFLITNGKIKQKGSINSNFNEFITIPLIPNTIEENKKRKYNRLQKKKEQEQIIQEHDEDNFFEK